MESEIVMSSKGEDNHKSAAPKQEKDSHSAISRRIKNYANATSFSTSSAGAKTIKSAEI
jgi:hypothetical protein